MRRRRGVRARTLAVKRSTVAQRVLWSALYPASRRWRPRTRADCIEVIRPCPYVSCRYHLYLDVNPTNGSIKLNFPDLEPWELDHSCALDVANLGGLELERIGEMINLTRERVRQIQYDLLKRISKEMIARGIW